MCGAAIRVMSASRNCPDVTAFLIIKFIISAAIYFRLTPSNRKYSLVVVEGHASTSTPSENFMAKVNNEKIEIDLDT